MQSTQVISIGTAQDRDLNLILKIWKEGWMMTHSKSQIKTSEFEKFIENFSNRKYPFEFWTIKKNNHLSGWVSILPAFYHPMKEKSDAEISIYIDQQDRNSRFGTLITTQVLNELERSKIDNVWAFVSKFNQNSKKMCLSSGMHLCGETSTKFLLIKEYFRKA